MTDSAAPAEHRSAVRSSASGARGNLDELKARAGPIGEWRVPTIVLGLLIAIATWHLTINYPTAGLDQSWGGGLYFAIEDGLGFGPDIAFTYGPLGFLSIPVNWDTTLVSLAFCWIAAQHIGLSCGLVWALRRSLGGIVATVVAFLVIALLPTAEIAFPLAALLCFAALARDRARFSVVTLVVVGATFAAVLTLVKLSVGPPLAILFLLALIGARARAWQLIAYAGLFVVEFLLLWVASGQVLGDLGDFVVNGRQIISGYSEAMLSTAEISDFEKVLILIGTIGASVVLVAGSALLDYRDRRARLFGIAIAALAGFSVFKEGIVRMDVTHLCLFFATIALIWLALPWSKSRRPALLAGAIVLAGIAIPVNIHFRPGQFWHDIDAPTAVKTTYEEIDALLSPDQRTARAAFARAFMQADYDIDPATLAELEGHSVSVEPWEIGAVYAYDLDWAPLPVIQGYSAYTSELDHLNAERVASPSGPDRILRAKTPGSIGGRQGVSLDNRYVPWDPPEQALAELCNFAPLRTTSRWQVLGRVPDRCSEPQQIGSVESSYGETVDVPDAGPGEVVFVRIEGAGVSGFESLRALLYRAEVRRAVVDGTSYRLVPGTAGDGLLLRGDPAVIGVGTFAQAPQTATISLRGPSGDLRYDFYSMKVEAAAGSGGGKARG